MQFYTPQEISHSLTARDYIQVYIWLLQKKSLHSAIMSLTDKTKCPCVLLCVSVCAG